jgi:hypothetical protein
VKVSDPADSYIIEVEIPIKDGTGSELAES